MSATKNDQDGDEDEDQKELKKELVDDGGTRLQPITQSGEKQDGSQSEDGFGDFRDPA